MVPWVVPVVVFDLVNCRCKREQHGEDHAAKLLLGNLAKVTEVSLPYDRQHWMSVNVPQRNIQHDGDSNTDAYVNVHGEFSMVLEGGDNWGTVAMPNQVNQRCRITRLFEHTTVTPTAG